MQSLPGFRDFLPRDCAARNYIFDRWREVARRYGFVEWDGPILEPTELYTKKSGAEIVGQLFNFTDKGGREVSMRPELTPTLARVIAAHEREFKKPLKWYSIPQCFRYEKTQRGRLREHFQFNADIIGEDSVEADAELIALCIDLLRALGLSDADIRIEISDRRAWQEFFPQLGITPEQGTEFLNVIDKWSRETDEVISGKLQQFGVSIADVMKFTASANVESFERISENLNSRGLLPFCQFNLQIVRGLAYYTGLVFEVFGKRRESRAIAGGGRYDNLIEHLSDGAVSLPAVGFAMGDVVLADLIAENPIAKARMEKNIAAQQDLDIYVVIANGERRANAIALIQALRNKKYRVDYSLTPEKVPKQFTKARNLGACMAILVGDEWPDVTIKNFQNGEQERIPNQELLSHLDTLMEEIRRQNQFVEDL